MGELRPIFDNGATTDEVRFLAQIFRATGDARYLHAVENGIDYILIAQYPSGGWRGPIRRTRNIIGISRSTTISSMPTGGTRRGAAFQRGIECIVQCQIKLNGKLTVWCAQHDEKDFSSRPGRLF